MTEVDIFGVEDKCAFFNVWNLVFSRSWMRQYPISERFGDPEENFEILNLKKRKKIDYLAMPKTYGNIHIFSQFH